MWYASGFYDFKTSFQDTGANWDLMKTGFEAIEKRWPTSLWNINAFCHFAVLANDKVTAKRLFDRIGNRYYPEIWGDKDTYDQGKNWANTP